jgi:c-di-GMP-binding flagellar brake protein YcgR
LTSITDLDWRPGPKVLIIESTDRQRRITGKAVEGLYAALRRARRGEQESLSGALVASTTNRHDASLVAVSGQLRLDLEFLTFQPWSAGMETDAARIRVETATLKGVRLEVETQRVRVELPDASEAIFDGAAAGQTWVALRAMGFDSGAAPEHPLPPVWNGQGQLGAGPIGSPAWIAISGEAVYAYKETLRADISGDRSVVLPFGQVWVVQREGHRQPVLTLVSSAAEPASVQLESSGISLLNLGVAMLDQGRSGAAWGGVRLRAVDRWLRLTEGSLRGLLEDHADKYPVGRGLMGKACLWVDGEQRLVRGWIVVLNTGVLFLPANEEQGLSWFVEGPRLDRTRSTLSGNHLRVVEGSRERLLLLAGDEAGAAAFFKVLADTRPSLALIRDRYPFIEPLLGIHASIRLSAELVEILSVRQVRMGLDEDGLALFLDHPIPPVVGIGLRVSVEVADADKVRTFRSHIGRVGEGPGGTHLLVMGLPESVDERENGRRAFRVVFPAPIRLIPVKGVHDRRASGNPVDGELVDLSWTGVGLRLHQTFPIGTVFKTRLELGIPRKDFVLEVVHTRKGTDEAIHHGARFLDTSAAHQRELQAVVVRRQIQEITLRKDAEEEEARAKAAAAAGKPGGNT